tara:strand:+ start:148 stop:558 length:411 start_codon:yes stop_codon:yes gene_type:complete
MLNILNHHADNLKTAFELEGEEGQFEYLIDIGKSGKKFEDLDKIENNKMSGCLAQVWIKFYKKEDRNIFEGDSDAFIVRGLVKILTEALSGMTDQEIKDLKHDVVNKLGLGPSLSARRQVGMMAMIDHAKKLIGVK